MRKIYLLLAMLPLAVQAQITINQQHAWQPGTSHVSVFFEVPATASYDASPGANKVWDFRPFRESQPGDPLYIRPDTVSFYLPTQVPFGTAFSWAALATTYRDFSPRSLYRESRFIGNGAGGLYPAGSVVESSDTSTTGWVTNYRSQTYYLGGNPQVTYPLTYNSTRTQTYIARSDQFSWRKYVQTYPTDTSRWAQKVTETVTVDGWGQLYLPGSSTSIPVLRVRRYTISTDTNYVRQNNVWSLDPRYTASRDTALTDEFYTDNGAFQVAYVPVDRRTNTASNGFFTKEFFVTSLAPRAEVTVRTWPNPAHGSFYLQSEVPFDNVRLISIDGRTHAVPYTRDGIVTRLDISGLAPGVYGYRAVRNGAVSTGRVVVE